MTNIYVCLWCVKDHRPPHQAEALYQIRLAGQVLTTRYNIQALQ